MSCPYNCQNGKVFNVALKVLEDCPHCKNLRIEEVAKTIKNLDTESEDDLCKRLNIRKSLIGMNFDMNAILPDFTRKEYTPNSIADVEKSLRELMNKAIQGVAPEQSYLIYLGYGANIDIFVYQYLLRCYKENLTVSPFITAYDLAQSRKNSELSEADTDSPIYYENFLKTDICVIMIDTGSTKLEIRAVKGLMEQRAFNNKPTIIITRMWGVLQYSLIAESGSYLYLATPVLLKRIQSLSNESARGSAAVVQQDVTRMSQREYESLFDNQGSFGI